MLLVVAMAPGTLALTFLAVTGMGVRMMAESGSYRTSNAAWWGGLLLLAGLAALWISVITGAASGGSPLFRRALLGGLGAGLLGALLSQVGVAGNGGGEFALVLSIPLMLAAAMHAFRLLRPPAGSQ